MIDKENIQTLNMCLPVWSGVVSGLPAGIGRSSTSSNSSDIKREDKEDDENSSIADKSEDEKKESKATRNRIRYLA